MNRSIEDTQRKRCADTVLVMRSTSCVQGRGGHSGRAFVLRSKHVGLSSLVNKPWLLRVGSDDLIVRPASPRDLTAVAAMHARCSASSLLERYRAGGKGPSVPAMEHMIRDCLSFIAATHRGDSRHGGGGARP